MAIWKQAVPLGPVTDTRFPVPNTIGAHIGLRITEIGEDYVRGTMPVDSRTKQPYGRLHGGASCVLAEELGSVAASWCTDPTQVFVVGLEINANHIRGATGGLVTGTARPLHIGNATQVWEIRIEDEQQRLVCISRLTMAVVKLSEGKKS